MIGLALLVSAVTAAAAGLVAAWAKYCGNCDGHKILEYFGLRSAASAADNNNMKPPDIPCNEKEEEKIPISHTETAIPSYQVSAYIK